MCINELSDGKIISGSHDATIKIWDPLTGNCTLTLIGHGSSVSAIAILHDNKIVSGSCDNTIKIWNIL